MKNTIKKHKYKIMIGVPVMFMLVVSILPTGGTTNMLTLIPSGNTTIDAGDIFDIDLSITVDDRTPVNVAGGTITFPKDLVEITAIATDDSIVDLWAEQPSFSNELGIANFGGGMLTRGGFTGDGHILHLSFKAKHGGVAVIDLTKGLLLAHDGRGTSLLSKTNKLTYIIAGEGAEPSYDLNGDGIVSIADVWAFSIPRVSYDPKYDLNRDGKVNFTDLGALLDKI